MTISPDNLNRAAMAQIIQQASQGNTKALNQSENKTMTAMIKAFDSGKENFEVKKMKLIKLS